MLEPNKVIRGSSQEDVLRMIKRYRLAKFLRKLFGEDKKKNIKPKGKEDDKC